MLNLQASQILSVYPTAKNLTTLIPEINELCEKYEINTPNRICMFIAQTLHESGGFRYLKEIWGNTSWQILYENNLKLGNDAPGDGKLFMGRGLMQLTGKKNYKLFAEWANDPSIVTNPDIVSTPKYAVLSAIFYWDSNNLNKSADADDIALNTRLINGKKMLGLEERKEYYHKLKATF